MGQNFIRTPLATIQGCAVPSPYGGKTRMVMVDLNPDALYSRGLSPTDVSNALGNQNLILPAGTAKIGDRDYQIKVNSSPRILSEINAWRRYATVTPCRPASCGPTERAGRC